MTAKFTWKKYNTVILYNEEGRQISQIDFSTKEIKIRGCAKCKTPPALRKASRGKVSSWSISLKGGLFTITVDGEVLYERQLPKECSNIYAKAKRFSFSKMSCENTFSFLPDDMEAGKRITPDCSGSCPLVE